MITCFNGITGTRMCDQISEESDDTDLDPRVQIELEKLNSATNDINSLEVKLDEANTTFRMLLNDSIKRLKSLSKKLGSCIEKARPYFEALELSKKAQVECQRAAVQYQRASEIHQAAKEMVALAEQRFLSKQHEWQFDNARQEMLNHAIVKVMEAETKKAESETEHQKKANSFKKAEQKLQELESKLKRSISKSRSYFDEKELCQRHLTFQKEKVEFLQKQLAAVKSSYASSLKKLEKISEEIHLKRGNVIRGIREPGVGAENDAIAEMDLKLFQSKYKSFKNDRILVDHFEDISKSNFDGMLEDGDQASLGNASTSTNLSDEIDRTPVLENSYLNLHFFDNSSLSYY